MSNTQITVPEFLQVRQHVAELLKANSSTQISTRIRQAENLLQAGVIDILNVLEKLKPDPPVEDTDIPDPDEHSYDNGPDL